MLRINSLWMVLIEGTPEGGPNAGQAQEGIASYLAEDGQTTVPCFSPSKEMAIKMCKTLQQSNPDRKLKVAEFRRNEKTLILPPSL